MALLAIALLLAQDVPSKQAAEPMTVPPMVAPPKILSITPVPSPPAPRRPHSALQPSGNPQNWVTEDDYPAVALRESLEGGVGFVLDVGAGGRVSGCTVIRSSGWDILDQTTCTLLRRRAQFLPATDADGKPIAAHYRSRVIWKIPERQLSRRVSWARITSVLIDENGAVTSCRVRGFGQVAEGIDGCAEARDMSALAGLGLHGPGQGSVLVDVVEWNRFEDMPLPRGFSEPAGEVAVRREAALEVDADGFVRGCTVVTNIDDGVLTGLPCIPDWNFTPDTGGGDTDRRARSGYVVVRLDPGATTKTR